MELEELDFGEDEGKGPGGGGGRGRGLQQEGPSGGRSKGKKNRGTDEDDLLKNLQQEFEDLEEKLEWTKGHF